MVQRDFANLTQEIGLRCQHPGTVALGAVVFCETFVGQEQVVALGVDLVHWDPLAHPAPIARVRRVRRTVAAVVVELVLRRRIPTLTGFQFFRPT